MKAVLVALAVLFLGLQYELWFASGGVLSILKLRHSVEQQLAQNEQLKLRNINLIDNIDALQSGQQALEGRARNDLGMIKKGEVFYQVVP